MNKKIFCVSLRKEGKSFRDIAKIQKVPLSTVFLWTKTVEISAGQKRILYEKSMRKLQESRERAQKAKRKNYLEKLKFNLSAGKDLIGQLSEKKINYVCAALYWGEGFKKDSRLGLANSDPDMIKFFIYWLVNKMGVLKDKIRLSVGINIIFSNRIKKIEKYWSEVTTIPLNQFQKPFFQKPKIKRIYPNKDEYYGVLRIRAIGQNDVFRKILGMVEQLKNESRKLLIRE